MEFGVNILILSVSGRLPWYQSDKEGPHFGSEMLLQVREWKKWSLEVDRPALFGGLPAAWEEIHNVIKNCQRDEPAPIAKVRRLMEAIVLPEGIDTSQPLDWQVCPQLRHAMEQAASLEVAGKSNGHGDV